MTLACPNLAFKMGAVDNRHAWGVALWQPGTTDNGYGALWSSGSSSLIDSTVDLRGVSWVRGRLSSSDRVGASTLKATLSNPNAKYDSWVPTAWPGASAPVQVLIGSTSMFVGKIDVYNEQYRPVGAGATRDVDAWLEVDATDALADLAIAPGQTGAPPVELAGARVNRLLSIAGWSGGATVDPGTVTMAAYTRNTQALDELWLVADSEGGWLYANGSGTIRFADANAIAGAWSQSTPQVAVFTDGYGGTSGLPGVFYDTVSFIRDRGMVANDITIANQGGTAQHASDVTSMGRHGDRTFQRLDLIGNADANAQTLANTILAARTSDGPHATVVFQGDRDANATSVATSLDLLQRVSVQKWNATQSGQIVAAGVVDAIAHDITPDVWQVTVHVTVTDWRQYPT